MQKGGLKFLSPEALEANLDNAIATIAGLVRKRRTSLDLP
jgi:hypothetical protein